MDESTLRALAAALLVAAYAGLCLAVWQRHRRHRPALGNADAPAAAGVEPTLIAYGSQTGFAEQLARHAAQALHGAGVPAHVMALSELTGQALEQARRALFVVSTCGEGDPPDNAVAFARRLLGADLALSGLHYGVLALGDRSYANFCAFGRTLDGWLQQRGAQRLFERVDVDNGNPDALQTWHRELGRVAQAEGLADWQAGRFEDWRLVERRRLNTGSAGGAVYHLALEPTRSPLPSWEAGDLLQLLAPEAARPRDYSIASVPADGRVHLLVRQQRGPDGRLGMASGWLTEQAAVGSSLRARLRVNNGFRIGGNAHRPLILIGNGTGLAGLRAHLKAHAGRCWLLFGERQAAHDFHYRQDIEGWRQRGALERLDAVFSRDQAERRYVQHRLLEAADELRAWLAAGAAIYVCGSRAGMASGVHDALVRIVGEQAMERLVAEGRLRRDVY
jgi:sulfite reductase (NADPH) flavoprotein alpha-component